MSMMTTMVRIAAGAVAAAVLAGPHPCLGQTSPWMVNAIMAESKGGGTFRSVTGMTVDPATGEIYVLDAGRNAVDVLDREGLPVFSFTHWITDAKTGQRLPGEPHDIVIAPGGEVFITDFFSRVIDVLNIRGERIGQIDVLDAVGWDDAGLRPEKLALGADGFLFCTVTGNRSGVIRCHTDGSGCEVVVDATAEKIECLTGMGVAADGRIAVLDMRGAPAVRIYGPDGKQQIGFGGHDVEQGDLSYPNAFVFADDGTYWIADGLRHAVKHYSADGQYLEYIGGFGSAPGNLRYPSAVTGDGVSRLYVADRVGRRVQEYVLPGALASPGSHDSSMVTDESKPPSGDDQAAPVVVSEPER